MLPVVDSWNHGLYNLEDWAEMPERSSLFSSDGIFTHSSSKSGAAEPQALPRGLDHCMASSAARGSFQTDSMESSLAEGHINHKLTDG